MPIKITETKIRDCCQVADLKLFHGGHMDKNFSNEPNTAKTRLIWFCQHCGQLWHWDRPAGDIDYGYERLDIKEFLL